MLQLPFFALLAFIFSGCCTVEESQPGARTSLQTDIIVSENSNPDSDGRPTPVTVRIYQLESGRNFEQADFQSLLDNDEMALGADLLFKEERDAHPGTRIPIQQELQETARYLGVMATFRDFQNGAWRALTELSAESASPLAIEIDESSVLIRQP
uniref:Type VI secretion system protein VasD n=1 Tax=Candidatus Kentrum sp. LPFa TaxID=2126335 RepID=A0A450XW60_9GAMM|nr:MAG: type VI secretion system protein VasD [Candidatus Kentron sp. LPFa]VFK33506.1 MAG: type VI secretion system protein VasD [Candidatus Kentron sp. LPFa]